MAESLSCAGKRNNVSNLELAQERALNGDISIDEVDEAEITGATR
jgi:hypothetical protein